MYLQRRQERGGGGGDGAAPYTKQPIVALGARFGSRGWGHVSATPALFAAIPKSLPACRAQLAFPLDNISPLVPPRGGAGRGEAADAFQAGPFWRRGSNKRALCSILARPGQLFPVVHALCPSSPCHRPHRAAVLGCSLSPRVLVTGVPQRAPGSLQQPPFRSWAGAECVGPTGCQELASVLSRHQHGSGQACTHLFPFLNSASR